MRLRVLIPVTIVLIVAAFWGVVQAAAKDDTTTFEGVVFWLSLPALPVLLLVLLGLVVTGIWRAARGRSRSTRAA